MDEVCINVSGAEDLVKSYLRSDDDDDDRYVGTLDRIIAKLI